MKCFFKKANALDFFGYPTLDGLVNLYTENVSDHNYFMAVLKITNFCLKGVNIKYKINQKTGKLTIELNYYVRNLIGMSFLSQETPSWRVVMWHLIRLTAFRIRLWTIAVAQQ